MNTFHGIHRIINWFVQKVPRGTGQQRVGTQPCLPKGGHKTMPAKGRAHNEALQRVGTQSTMSAEGETLQKSIKPFLRVIFLLGNAIIPKKCDEESQRSLIGWLEGGVDGGGGGGGGVGSQLVIVLFRGDCIHTLKLCTCTYPHR